jgi:transcriptional regulator with XRE-family HTH domain
MSIENPFDNGKIAVAIRTARTALGWSQQEFAEKMGVAKSTVARIETLEMATRGDFVVRAMQLFRQAGVEVDLTDIKTLPITVHGPAIWEAVESLADQTKRRSDRKKGLAALLPDDTED